MKRFVYMMLCAVMLCFTACGESYTVVEKPFPLDEQQATVVFQNYELDYILADRYTMNAEQGVEAYGYSINSPDNSEKGYYGNIYLYTGEKSGRRIEYSSNWDRKILATDVETLNKIVMAVCDIYGEIENKEKIVNDFISFAAKTEKKDKLESEEWQAVYGQLYFNAYITANKDGTERTLNSFSIRNKQRKEFDDGAKEREAQRYIESNPYKFTDKKTKYPRPVTAKKMKEIFDTSPLDFTLAATEDTAGYEIHGSKTVAYMFRAGESTEDCGCVSTNYNVSGKRVILEMTYMYEDAVEVMTQNDFIIEAAKIVCRVYGDVKDEEGLIEKAEQKVRQENADCNRFNSSTWYVENKGMYLVAEHGRFRPEDARTACIRLWLFTKDSLRAEFYPYRENDGWEGQLYREIIGNS